jgi:hypothetical protein
LSGTSHGDIDAIEAAKDVIDGFCRFQVTVGSAAGPVNRFSQIALQADNGRYLSVINRGDTNPIEAAKSAIDDFCWFTAIACNDKDTIALLGNLRYLSRINRDDANPIEAAKGSIDPYSQFRLIKL